MLQVFFGLVDLLHLFTQHRHLVFQPLGLCFHLCGLSAAGRLQCVEVALDAMFDLPLVGFDLAPVVPDTAYTQCCAG